MGLANILALLQRDQWRVPDLVEGLSSHPQGITAGLLKPGVAALEGMAGLTRMMPDAVPFKEPAAAAMDALSHWGGSLADTMREDYLVEDPTLARLAITGIPEGALYAADAAGGALGLKRGLTAGLSHLTDMAPAFDDALEAGVSGLTKHLQPDYTPSAGVRPSGPYRFDWSDELFPASDFDDVPLTEFEWGHATPFAEDVWKSRTLLPRILQSEIGKKPPRFALAGGPDTEVSIAPLHEAAAAADEMRRMHSLHYAKSSDEAAKMFTRWVNEDVWNRIGTQEEMIDYLESASPGESQPTELAEDFYQWVKRASSRARDDLARAGTGTQRQEAYSAWLARRDMILNEASKLYGDPYISPKIPGSSSPRNPGFVQGSIKFTDPNPDTVQTFPISQDYLKYVAAILEDPVGTEVSMAQSIPIYTPAVDW